MSILFKVKNWAKKELGQKSILACLWLLILILTLTMPIFETVIVLRGGYDLAHIQASAGRNFFTIFSEGYESAFVYEQAILLILVPIILISLIPLFIFLPSYFKSEEVLSSGINNCGTEMEKAVKNYGKAHLPWFTGVFLIISLSAPEISCLVIYLQSANALFLSTSSTMFSLISSIIIRALLAASFFLISHLSSKIVKPKAAKLSHQLQELYAQEADDHTDSDEDRIEKKE